jgi:crotonobetainyl-CoA hydratase
MTVRTETRAHVLEITLDRPTANAIDIATSRALHAAFVELRDNPDLRVAILTGGGDRFFCAGLDLKAAAIGGENETADFGPGGFAGLLTLLGLNKPLIAAVNGLAVGGGFELVLASDIVVAADHAEFCLPETRVGNLADMGGVQRLPRRVPRQVAMDLLLTGRRMTAREAAHYGLVGYLAPAAELMDRARGVAAAVAAGAPLSIAAIKEVCRGVETLSDDEALRAVAVERRFPTYARMLQSEDFREGPRAFAEKRPPVWSGK